MTRVEEITAPAEEKNNSPPAREEDEIYIEIRRRKDGALYQPATGLVFKTIQNRLVVVGKLDGEEIADVEVEDLELCSDYGFMVLHKGTEGDDEVPSDDEESGCDEEPSDDEECGCETMAPRACRCSRVLELRMHKNGRLCNPDTGFVFGKEGNRLVVVGKLKEEIVELSDEDVLLCREKRFSIKGDASQLGAAA